MARVWQAMVIALVAAVMLAGSAWGWSQLPADADVPSGRALAADFEGDSGTIMGLPLFFCHW